MLLMLMLMIQKTTQPPLRRDHHDLIPPPFPNANRDIPPQNPIFPQTAENPVINRAMPQTQTRAMFVAFSRPHRRDQHMKPNTQNRAKPALKSYHPSRLTRGRPMRVDGAWQNRTTFGRGLPRMARFRMNLGARGRFLAAGVGTNWAKDGLI